MLRCFLAHPVPRFASMRPRVPCAAQVDARQVLRQPPLPLATLALQKEAITHLRMPGERMMKVAEELYQEGFISYPRTETDCFDPAYDLKVAHPQTPVVRLRLGLCSLGGLAMYNLTSVTKSSILCDIIRPASHGAA